MIEGQYLYYGDSLQDVDYIKKLILEIDTNYIKFQKKYMNEIISMDFDEAIYGVIYVDKKPIGAGKLLFDGLDFYIHEIMILSISEKEVYYDFLIRMLIDKAILLNGKKIQVAVPSEVASIYLNIGFQIIGTKVDECQQDWSLLELHFDSIRKSCNEFGKNFMV